MDRTSIAPLSELIILERIVQERERASHREGVSPSLLGDARLVRNAIEREADLLLQGIRDREREDILRA